MKKDEIPQQKHDIYEGETKVVYAVNNSGKLEGAQTSGWDAEVEVLQQAIDDIDRHAAEALDRVRRGLSSPLEYHMYAQRMDVAMLAQAAGYFKWRVRKHLKPNGFSKLRESQKLLYCQILGINLDTLKSIPHD